MKILYTALLMFIAIGLSAQDVTGADKSLNEEIPGFKLYPNPAFENVVYITTAHNASKEIVVYDVFGEVVLRDVINGRTLYISDLVPGVYVLQVMEDNKTTTRKLVVK
ncbi:MAG: T9SS type A sorting domain-containing protein [Flavobacteriales bacterium]|nr:MAG: T9SS type A sorting domain-containing protein [Flavobacteriales bacterium]